MPTPCSRATFSSTVISFMTRSARSSGERLVFIHGPVGACAFCGRWALAELATQTNETVKTALKWNRTDTMDKPRSNVLAERQAILSGIAYEWARPEILRNLASLGWMTGTADPFAN